VHSYRPPSKERETCRTQGSQTHTRADAPTHVATFIVYLEFSDICRGEQASKKGKKGSWV